MFRRLALALALVAFVAATPRSAAADGCFTHCSDFSGWSDYSNSNWSEYSSYFGNKDWNWGDWDWGSWNNGDWEWSGWENKDWRSYEEPQVRDGYSVTEPGTFFLLATGLIGFGYIAWQRREDELLTDDDS